ncbi:twin-arginine translocation signal domain-containing protein [Georgenia soli]
MSQRRRGALRACAAACGACGGPPPWSGPASPDRASGGCSARGSAR